MREWNRRLRLALVTATALALFACGGDPGLTQGLHVFTTADGVEMPYTVTGDGDTTVLFVHCWMCEGSFWDAQVPVVSGPYRSIVIDLPGHGDGGDNRESWTIDGYGEDVAGLIGQLDLQDVVLVGHSMGGPVSLRAAALAGDRVVGIVAVDTLHNAEFDFDSPEIAQMVTMFDADYHAVCDQMVGAMFVEEGVEDVQARVRRVGCEEANDVAGIALIHNFAELDFPTMFREAGVPIRAINAAAPNKTEIEINRKYADFDAVLMDGVGHYLMMTRPEQFNELLMAQIDDIVSSS